MILAFIVLAVLAPSPDTEPPELDVDACLQDDRACVQVAGAHFDAGRFDAAVRLFEALALAYPWTPKYHYFAGLAREGAGDDTAAYVHMRRFLASDADDGAERKRAERRAATILVRSTRVSVHIPPHDAEVNLGLKRIDAVHADAPKLSFPVAILPASDHHYELALPLGEWEISIEPSRQGDREFHPQRITVRDGVRTLKLELVATPVRHELTLDLGPSRALARGLTLDLHRPGGPAFTLTPTTPTLRCELPPGNWTYHARARGFLPKTATITLDGPAQQPIRLTPKWPPERRKRLALGLGLGAAGLATGATGAVLLAVADQRLKNIPSLLLTEKYEEINVSALILADTGSAMLGTTVGVWIGAVSSSASSRRLWITGAAIGAASLLGGTAGYVYRAPKSWYDIPRYNIPTSLATKDPDLLITAGLMGLGTGLLAASVVNLATLRRTRPSGILARKRVKIISGYNSAHLHITF